MNLEDDLMSFGFLIFAVLLKMAYLATIMAVFVMLKVLTISTKLIMLEALLFAICLMFYMLLERCDGHASEYFHH